MVFLSSSWTFFSQLLMVRRKNSREREQQIAWVSWRWICGFHPQQSRGWEPKYTCNAGKSGENYMEKACSIPQSSTSDSSYLKCGSVFFFYAVIPFGSTKKKNNNKRKTWTLKNFHLKASAKCSFWFKFVFSNFTNHPLKSLSSTWRRRRAFERFFFLFSEILQTLKPFWNFMYCKSFVYMLYMYYTLRKKSRSY